ncbi:MAG: DUF951 domain-containing protein [Coprothermobacterota bacterium]|nr:DUF951 domain-containing protein [Coprothermobacterota bacterium]
MRPVLLLTMGDLLLLRKKHPCGSDRWEVVRLGADIRIRCLGCGHLVLLPRSQLEKRVRKKLSSCPSEESKNGGAGKPGCYDVEKSTHEGEKQ